MIGTVLIGGITKATVAQLAGTAVGTYAIQKLALDPAYEAYKLYKQKKQDDLAEKIGKEMASAMAEELTKKLNI